jgi:hypothetical protein
MTSVFAGPVLLALVTGCAVNVPKLTYASLIREVQAGNVNDVKFSSDGAIVALQAPIPSARSGQDLGEDLIYDVPLPADEEMRQELIDLLREHNVPFSMTDL